MPIALPRTHNPAETRAWSALSQLAQDPRATDLRRLFAEEPERFGQNSGRVGDLFIDFSKQRLNRSVRSELLELAESMQMAAWIAALFSEAEINNTEHRAAMHWALRLPEAGADFAPSPQTLHLVLATRHKMYALAENLRQQRWLGASGKPLRKVVNLGIGGSDLGPRLVCDALLPSSEGSIRTAFVANVDAGELTRVLTHTPPEETLFVVTSKTFTTQETLRNAQSAKAWLEAGLGRPKDCGAHFLAVTANPRAAQEFGVPADHILPMWDWVGGRYSVWSAVGFSVAAQIGRQAFDAFLAGGHEIDRHFRTMPLSENLPVLLALIGVWNRNFLGFPDLAVVPYLRGLELFAPYLQQLVMESNGKAVRRDGAPLQYAACPAVWGTVGTSGQHAYFQWLHQGGGAPVDFVLAAQGETDLPEHQEMLLANALAQAQAFLQGKTAEQARIETPAEPELAAHRQFQGGRPSTTILMPRLDAARLGQLLALYEHITFAQAALWGINPFDQWGVELGKTMAGPLLTALRGGTEPADLDASTKGLLRELQSLRQK